MQWYWYCPPVEAVHPRPVPAPDRPTQHEVTVQATPTPAGLLIIVRDDGPGVAEGDLGRLFEPFYTGNDSSSRSSGIGLAITRRAVDLHGGSVRASNLDGAGLAVEISLPTAS